MDNYKTNFKMETGDVALCVNRKYNGIGFLLKAIEMAQNWP